MEKKRLLGVVYGRRPGDVTIQSCQQRPAIDVAVTNPLASSNLHISEPCESYATWKKHAYYDDDFKGTAFEFAAMVFETTGGVRFAAKHRAWARLSCNVQSSVSQCFL